MSKHTEQKQAKTEIQKRLCLLLLRSATLLAHHVCPFNNIIFLPTFLSRSHQVKHFFKTRRHFFCIFFGGGRAFEKNQSAILCIFIYIWHCCSTFFGLPLLGCSFVKIILNNDTFELENSLFLFSKKTKMQCRYNIHKRYSTKKRASRASALRADIARGIPVLPVTYPTGPTHWTRPLRPGS